MFFQIRSFVLIYNLPNESLIRILNYATKNIEFYKYLSSDCPPSYYDFPIIDKNTLINNYNKFLVNSKNLSTIKNWTSGTTGQPLQVQWTISDYQKSYFQLWKKRREWYGIIPTYRCLMFHAATVNETGNFDDNIVIQNNVMSLRKDAVFRNGYMPYLNMIIQFSPDWILGAPSIVLELAMFLQKKHISISTLKYIELNGETVQHSTKKFLQNFFEVPIGILYGAIEFNGIALSCPMGNLHVLDENVYLESCGGDLLVTSLSNKTMPLIRYKIGDQGEVGYCNCKCGSKSIVLSTLNGRNSENIILDDYIIPKSIFCRIIEEINIEKQKIKQYQIVVNISNSTVILKLLIESEYAKELFLSKKYFIDQLSFLFPHSDKISFDILFLTDPKKFLSQNISKMQEIIYI